MERQIIVRLQKSFEESAYEQDGVEYWLARDLQVLLEYEEWCNFLKVIDKAKISCRNAGQSTFDHFVEVNKMVDLGSGSKHEKARLIETYNPQLVSTTSTSLPLC